VLRRSIVARRDNSARPDRVNVAAPASAAGTGALPGYRLHPLHGDLEGLWSVTVSGNWLIVFRFEEGGVCDRDLTDDH
jgi:plasmid maintenance system killer protein